MKNKIIVWWLVFAVIGATVFTVAHAAKWTGKWQASTGHWVGTIKYKFDNTGKKAWTDAEKKVVREAIKEWEDPPDSDIGFEEVTDGADVIFKWDGPPSGDGDTAGEMIGGDDGNPPTGVNFNPNPNAGWYVDDDPTTDEAIPDSDKNGKKDWDLLSVAKHEIGHVLGLKHSFGTPAAMDTWGSGDRQRLTEDDRKAASKLYPPATPTPVPPTPTPEKVAPPAPTAKEYVAECNTYLEQGKPLLVEHTDCTKGIRLLRLAIEKSTTALELDPNDAEACFCRGMSRRWLEEELDEAIRDLECALNKGLEGDRRVEAETELAKLREKVTAPISVSMGPITCAEGWTESGEPINPGTTFSGCKKEIWCRWGLSNPSGEKGVTKWYYNGELACQHGHEFKDSWTWAESGWATDPGEECIKPGPYCVAAYIGTKKMTEGCFTIE